MPYDPSRHGYRHPGPASPGWAAVRDFDHWSEWTPTVISVEPLDPSPLVPGLPAGIFVPTGLLRAPDAISPLFGAVVSECEVGQAALRAELVQMWSTHHSATLARRTTVDAANLEVVATSMIEQRQRETSLHRVLLLTRRTLL